MRRPVRTAATGLGVALGLAYTVSAARAQDAAGSMAEMDHGAHAAEASAPDLAAADSPGTAAPPPVPTDHAADRLFPTGRMAAARSALMQESAWRGGALQIRELEYRPQAGSDGLAWRIEGWSGGDRDRLVLASEGEASLHGPAERIELAALWRHAIDPWFNLEAGLRHDIRPGPQRTYAMIGIAGMAPYWIHLEGQALVSTQGDVHFRLEAMHQLRVSGQLVLEPEARIDLALQDVPALRIGAGAERIELGARLGYAIRPEFAPYVGLHWERYLSGSARQRRAAGEETGGLAAVVGVAAFF